MVNKKILKIELSLFVSLIMGISLVPETHAGNPLVKFYQDHISAIDGNRCPMHPTCSEYCRQVFEKHGPVAGWVMACDRLVRCGRDEVKLSPHVIVHGRLKTLDRVKDNDFWWFDNSEPQAQIDSTPEETRWWFNEESHK